MATRKYYRIAAVAMLAAMPALSLGVVFQGTADPTFNSTAPTGSLANSGWQYEVPWLGFSSATAVAPHYLVTAAHLGGTVGEVVNGMTVTSITDFGDDLRLVGVDTTFNSYAPLYNTTTDGSESNKTMVVIGNGGPRGTEIHADNNPSNPLLGWNFASPWDGVRRWGENKVSGFANSNTLLAFAFDPTGSSNSVGVNEASLVGGDSGGGDFINVNGQWKLAGVNFATDSYSFTSGGATFGGALFNTNGLYDANGQKVATDMPANSYSSRVSSWVSSIDAIINLPPTWNTDASGTWGSTGTNFANGTPGNAAGAEVDFRSVITAARTVTLSGPQTAGTLAFDDSSSYTLTGSTITLDTTSTSTPAQIVVASGNHTIASALTLAKNLNINVIQASSTLSLSGQMSASGKTITQVGPGTVSYKNVRADTLTVQQGNVKIISNGTTSGTSMLNTLALNSSSLDLTNNDLVVNNGSLSSWSSSVKTGRNGGAWNGGSGIKSSTAATTSGVTGVGIANAGDVLGFTSGTKSWSGQTVTASSTLIKYTYVGDLNLDGVINGDDYFDIDNAYHNHSAATYENGDVNFDGRIDGDDYFLIDSNYSRQNGMSLSEPLSDLVAGATVQAVPEPASLGAIALACGAMMCRRQRRR